jgi:hypothetical protein
MMPLEMTPLAILTTVAVLLAAGAIVRWLWSAVRARGLDQWVPGAMASSSRVGSHDADAGPVDVFLAVCDHYEPEWAGADPQTALARVEQWCEHYPRLFDRLRDVDGRPPQHSFFFPQDQYRPEYLDRLAELIHAGYGDADIHLHHHDDTPEGLREKLAGFRDALFHQHGLLRRDPETGEIVYGFIHGNWALCNSRRDGKWCGVDHEIPILLETGCYADFTFPSAPSDTQPRTINSIYYAVDRPGQRKSHETGVRAAVGQAPPADSLLMIQGPLGFDFTRKKWGVVPRIENGDLLASHPPSIRRLPLWLNAGVTVAGRPEWRFVKLHTHGCNPANQRMWLSETVQRFHADLAEHRRRHPNFRYHYVSAWEMAQLVRLATRGVAAIEVNVPELLSPNAPVTAASFNELRPRADQPALV